MMLSNLQLISTLNKDNVVLITDDNETYIGINGAIFTKNHILQIMIINNLLSAYGKKIQLLSTNCQPLIDSIKNLIAKNDLSDIPYNLPSNSFSKEELLLFISGVLINFKLPIDYEKYYHNKNIAIYNFIKDLLFEDSNSIIS